MEERLCRLQRRTRRAHALPKAPAVEAYFALRARNQQM
jgi:hypothetical protein